MSRCGKVSIQAGRLSSPPATYIIQHYYDLFFSALLFSITSKSTYCIVVSEPIPRNNVSKRHFDSLAASRYSQDVSRHDDCPYHCTMQRLTSKAKEYRHSFLGMVG